MATRWIVVWGAMFLVFQLSVDSPTRKQFGELLGRVEAIEQQKCTLIAVNTPTGVTSLCKQ